MGQSPSLSRNSRISKKETERDILNIVLSRDSDFFGARIIEETEEGGDFDVDGKLVEITRLSDNFSSYKIKNYLLALDAVRKAGKSLPKIDIWVYSSFSPRAGDIVSFINEFSYTIVQEKLSYDTRLAKRKLELRARKLNSFKSIRAEKIEIYDASNIGFGIKPAGFGPVSILTCRRIQEEIDRKKRIKEYKNRLILIYNPHLMTRCMINHDQENYKELQGDLIYIQDDGAGIKHVGGVLQCINWNLTNEEKSAMYRL